MKFNDLGLKTKVIISVCLPLLIAQVIGVVSMIRFTSMKKADLWVDHTYQVIESATKIFGSAVDMQTGMRGFLLAGKEEFLDPYKSGEKATYSLINMLKEKVRDNPGQRIRLEKAESLIRLWQTNVSKSNIEYRRQIGKAATVMDLTDLIQKNHGKIHFDNFRAKMAEMINVEKNLLKKRQIEMKKTTNNTIIAILSCMIAAVIIGFLFALFITRDILKQIGGEPSVIALLANNVAKGNLDIPVDTKEQTGILAALMEMIKVLQSIVANVNAVVVDISAGKLFSRGEPGSYQGTWDELVKGINDIVEKMANHLDQIPAPFIILDNDFNILASNKANSEWLGRSREQIIGHKCYDVIKSSICKTAQCACVKAINSGKLETGEATALRGKERLSFSYRSKPIWNHKGVISGALEVFTDLTDVKKADWLKTGRNELNRKIQGEQDLTRLSRNIVTFLAEYISAQVAVFYITQEDGSFRLINSYAYMVRSDNFNLFKPGEGLIGQAALEMKSIMFSNVPKAHTNLDINSGMGESSPSCIYVIPLIYEQKVLGVMAFGSSKKFIHEERELLDMSAPDIAVILNSASSRIRLTVLLDETRSQQEELIASNEELEQQTRRLQESEEKLKAQQEEMEVTNEELEEKNNSLERQKLSIENTNKELDIARQNIELRAEEFAVASKYKSEFLANMSHELRTPLNSLLLLARSLTQNKEGNLTKEQIEAVTIVYKSGNNLLSLINEILDLSKIEAGQMTLLMEKVWITDLVHAVNANFQHMAKEKGLNLQITVDENVPESIFSDGKRVDQILKNLISNAIKFTKKGHVEIVFNRPGRGTSLFRKNLEIQKTLAVSVKDTGIGIPEEMQKTIFEAFQQVEGGSARTYGGTGLGLSISRELANLLGGEIQVSSKPGKGSVFTLFLPFEYKVNPPDNIKTDTLENKKIQLKSSEIKTREFNKIPDDRDVIQKKDISILVIEDDLNFAKLLLKHCHEKGFKCLVAATGEEGLLLTQKYIPKAVILDIRLPGMDGWAVLEDLKENTKTRHIPVHIMSVEDASIDALKKGAIGYLTKPAKKEELDQAFRKLEEMFSKEIKKLLVVEDDDILRKSIVRLIGNNDVHTTEAATGKETIEALKSGEFDCMILDLGLPDMSGFELLRLLDEKNMIIPPVIVYTGRELSYNQEKELYNHAETIIIKGVKSEERLLDEASLFLHRVFGKMPASKQKIIQSLHETDLLFKDKHILVVDDDMRNVFALSRIIEEKGMIVLKAEDGKKCLEILATKKEIDLILMDIMMPVMDGYETMKKIREQEKFRRLPIIALTAKAMMQDREKCIASGANDYLTKPVDVDRLFSMMRVWLYR